MTPVKRIIGADVARRASDAAASQGAQTSVAYLSVDEESGGQRLDNFLVRTLKGVPKTHIYRIIRSGEVRVNKGRATAQSRVNPGDSVRLPPLRQSERAILKRQDPDRQAMVSAPSHPTQNIELRLLFEDEKFLAVDKPAGMAVHGGSGVSFGLIERLRMQRPQAGYLELVHRLDRETSGVLLVAKKRSALRALQQQFRERETGKIYLAMVSGRWPARTKVLDQPLQKFLVDGAAGEERRVRVARAGDTTGMTAITLVKVVSQQADTSLLEVTIKTGRTHQIRVHLAHAGHPILGDDKYGDFDLNKKLAKGGAGTGLRRMFLHAWKIHIEHPTSHERMLIESPLAADLQLWLDSGLPSIQSRPVAQESP